MIAAIFGAALIGAALIDVYVTTVSMRGGGPLMSRLIGVLWRPVATSGRATHRQLEGYGAAMLPVMVLAWALLLYAGWTLVFMAHPDAVVNGSTGVPADRWERIYFTGYVITTLGNGEYRPDGTAWQLLTVGAALTGLLLITLAITYVTPVMNAVVQKRQVASSIVGLGPTPADVLANGWDGRSFTPLRTHLANLVPELTALAHQHVAYPILHYFHSPQRTTALPPAIVVLDDALTLMQHGVAEAHRLDRATVHSASGAVDVLLDALRAAHIAPADPSPDAPALAILDKLDIPSVDEESYAAATEHLAERRALLLGYAHSDGWTWPP